MDALEECDETNGQVSGTKIKELLESFQSEILAGVNSRLQTIKDPGLLPSSTNQEQVSVDALEGDAPTFCNGRYAEEGLTDQKKLAGFKGFYFPKGNPQSWVGLLDEGYARLL